MSLSTIGMISSLKVGQIAKCLEIQECSYGVKIIDGSFYWLDYTGFQSNIVSLNSCTLEYEWEIVPEYVDFLKAIDAFMNGKKICSYDSNDKLCNEYYPIKDKGEYISIWEISNCQWSIECEEQ
jgi:hypothetical protein